MVIFILFKNVTTFYTNIFWYVQPLGSFFCRKTDTQTETQTARSNSSLDVEKKPGIRPSLILEIVSVDIWNQWLLCGNQ